MTLAMPCKTDSADTCKYDVLTDDRDGQTYKTVQIGSQWWMTENLNYAYLQPTEQVDSSSCCYMNKQENCEKYGRLYLWSAVMDSVGKWSENGKNCGYMSNCTPKYPEQIPDHARPPKGYKPFYISHYGRHGARNNGSDSEYVLFRDMLTVIMENLKVRLL